MAALGAAAGAFQGDMEREAAAARRAQLGLQADSLAQKDRQFADWQTLEREQMALKREQMALEQQRFQANQDIKAQRTAIEQRNTDRSLTLDEKKFQADQESDLYQRGRNEKQDAWKQALDEQEMQAKQLDMTFQKERLSKFKILADQEKQTMAERKRLSQTALASAMKIGMESGGVVPLSVVQAVAKETGIPFQGMYFAPDGSFVSDVLKDGKTVQEVTPANVQAAIMRSMPGVFGEEAAKDFVTERRDRARYDSQFKRDALKAGAGGLSKVGERLLNNKLERIKKERSYIMKELYKDDAKAMRGDEEYQKLKDRLVQLDKDEDAAVYSAYGETPPAPSGAQGGGAGIGYTEQQINELGGLKVQALREANGDKAKAFDIFKQKKKQWESSHMNPDGSAATQRQAQPAELKPIQEPDMATSRFARLDETAKPGTATPAQDGSRFGRKPDFGSSSRNAPPSVSSTLRKNEPNTDLSPEDKEAMVEIYLESQKPHIDPLTRLPIDPVEYRRMKEAEYFKAKRDADQKQMKELFDGNDE